ncbi:alpha carbonic anhydrase [Kalaharituber pfeilii]|nr:alpha carbonic anhydrase [Kalaharituber pfeilii]
MQASIFLVTILSTLASACIYPRADATYGYTGELGPLGWHYLPNSTLCATGKNQSPINVSPAEGVKLAKPLVLKYPEYSQDVHVENNGHTILFTPKDAGANGTYDAILEGKPYELVQFHFHTPSEHRFLEEFYPLEVHFVHQDADGKLAVVGVFFDLKYGWGDDLLLSTTYTLDSLKENGSSKTIDHINFRSIMSVVQKSSIYTYSGSLTTPPCDEAVTWYVVQDSLPMSIAQFQAWKRVMKFNSRVAQNIPGRQNLIEFAATRTSEH